MAAITSALARRPALLLALALTLSPSPAPAAADSGRNTPAVLAAFREVVARPSRSTVRVTCDGADTALGAVVSPDGFVVTKASDLKGKVVCRLPGGRALPAKVVGVDEKTDLAMLKVDAADLVPVEWRLAKAEVGDWVASAGPGETPVAVGVVSVEARRPNRFEMGPVAPPPGSGFLGISLRPDDDGSPIIAVVSKGSAAEKAGLKPGDVVLRVGGKRVASADRLVATIQRYRVGQEIVLKVRRGDEEKVIRATLGKRPADLFNRGDRMNQMGSELSRKRNGFPVILQHDTVIKPKDCGGPLVDLDGRAVGINVARAGRTESYAIPANTVLALLDDLKSGKLAPKEEPDETRVSQLEGELKKLHAQRDEAEKALRAAQDEKKRADLQVRLAGLRKKIDATQADLDAARKDATK